MNGETVRARDRYRAIVAVHGRETFAFSGLKAGFAYWVDDDDAAAYVEVGGHRVAVGAPVGPSPDAAARFVRASDAADRRVSFFATESAIPGTRAFRIGQQPVFVPSEWAPSRSLREQLRRARAKGVTVREVHDIAPFRPAIEAMATGWLEQHHLQPMRFVVAVDPFYASDGHRYFVAERAGEVVAFLSAVPIPARNGWLVEDLFRGDGAPNGTTETLLDAFMRSVPEAQMVTLGLSPLAGPMPLLLRLARFALRPLYDFDGLYRFKLRMAPNRWEPVFLAHAPRRGLLALIASLRAFAGGSLVAFAARSIARHPSGPPFLLAVPLVPWTLLLAVLALTGNAAALGFDLLHLAGWIAFDALLAVSLYRAARKPRRGRLIASTVLGAIDTVLSLRHLLLAGLGSGAIEVTLRALATLAPLFGTLALMWALAISRRSRPPPRTRAPPASTGDRGSRSDGGSARSAR